MKCGIYIENKFGVKAFVGSHIRLTLKLDGLIDENKTYRIKDINFDRILILESGINIPISEIDNFIVVNN